ncbi:MAG TPA: SpoIID/LytB domain-containing protein [Gemmatimonadaceae bacterium]|nr:SpoIID/LytB domain-containing protein [Gemmatimonadaceae bacterium]
MKLRRVLVLGAIVACTTPAPPPIEVPEPEPAPAPAETRPPVARSAPPATRTPVDTSPPTVLHSPVHGARGGGVDVGEETIRVLLSDDQSAVHVSSPSAFVFTNAAGSLAARAARDQSWRVEHNGHRVRALRPDGVGTIWSDGPLVARAPTTALLSVDGKPYRGDVAFYGGDSGVLVVNVVRIDDYLRGVVPLEIGARAPAESAAVQAQAVTARSYAYTHLESGTSREYDVTGGTLDQAYGGVAAESPVSSEAVESTRTLVLEYAGRVVNAPYHSTCGGSTAAASEVWHSADEPYLQRVSDRIPGTSRYYCDISPRFTWTRTLDATTLDAALSRYLATYATVPGQRPGIAQGVTIGSHTASGRVGTVTFTTSRGNFVVRGNDIRFVLRSPGGEILNSTYFSVDQTLAPDGSLARLTIHGMGYGHGVGMCQWGAIGRARAGQDFRTILRTYYPGTTVGPAR